MYNIDKIRRKEYKNLNKTCYLDYGGTTPYAKSLVNDSAKLWKSGLYGNPHSHSASSVLATEYVNRARTHVLEFFRADPEHFDVVFVANATAAIKLVACIFQEKGFWYGFHGDAHTSLVGIRELARNGYHCFSSDNEMEAWITSPVSYENGVPQLPVEHSDIYQEINDAGFLKLIGYPAQSNMNGHRTPMDWAHRIRKRACVSGQAIYTLLDAAAYCSSSQLDLSNPETAPDFTSFSFYKIFGMPDIGALIIRKESSPILMSRRYFGGGTVDMVIAHGHFHAKKTESIHDVLEDGTLPFHSLIMLDTAITLHKRLFFSMDAISKHATELTIGLYRGLSSLRHANGRLVCEIYKDMNSTYGDSTTQGPTIAFNIRRANGALIRYDYVETLASACNIQIRTGGVCNPGGIAGHLQLSSWEMRRNYCEGFRCGEPFKVRGGKTLGIVRASLGGMSSQHDVDTLVKFVHHFFVETEFHDSRTSKSLDAPQQFWIVKKIQLFPILHCPGWKLPEHQSWEIESSRLAMDGDWCLLGKLFLEGMVRGVNSKVGVSLWELPQGDWVKDSLEQIPSKAYRVARQFTSQDIEAFFTFIFGFPATLARFYEFHDTIPAQIWSEKSFVKQGSQGINVQFAGDIEHDAHIILSPKTVLQVSPQKYPNSLRLGSQRLILMHPTNDVGQDEAQGSLAQYYRHPDETETLVSQNTAVRIGNPVTGSWLFPAKDKDVDFRLFHFCSVVGCGEKREEYGAFIEHLTSHAESFVPPHQKTWRQGMIKLLACFCR
ncbi:putative molybdopterin cofactor sulfurase [Talaromyces proteolyticus]|uniref:Molybdopterin cofactor sulfurase n=1 Tax=Talaromyces proteolyticus TaxID=1131652 RepID=A0AAD4L7G9_9EURO|nr:putative molybdopterin cofactor sulfurase [Talaromyces proteolyticus]KAH8705995.1 putative molybdopterin cofactor sulfurase [Talaromyces proteolyticus]